MYSRLNSVKKTLAEGYPEHYQGYKLIHKALANYLKGFNRTFTEEDLYGKKDKPGIAEKILTALQDEYDSTKLDLSAEKLKALFSETSELMQLINAQRNENREKNAGKESAMKETLQKLKTDLVSMDKENRFSAEMQKLINTSTLVFQQRVKQGVKEERVKQQRITMPDSSLLEQEKSTTLTDSSLAQGSKNAEIKIILSRETYYKAKLYLIAIQKIGLEKAVRQKKIGKRLAYVLHKSNIEFLTTEEFIDALYKTKKPVIFPEFSGSQPGVDQKNRHLISDGSDWTVKEWQMLSAMIDCVEDAAIHNQSTCAKTYLPFTNGESRSVTLLGPKGALLDGIAPDSERVLDNGKFDKNKYKVFLIENLLPALLSANSMATGAEGLITLPILGGGVWGGENYTKDINLQFPEILKELIQENSQKLSNIKAIICTGSKIDSNEQINEELNFIQTTQWCGLSPDKIIKNSQIKIDNGKVKLFAMYAADGASWPFNDALGGSPSTSEGGMGMAVNAIALYSKIEGKIDTKTRAVRFIPVRTSNQGKYINFEEIIEIDNITLNVVQMQIVNAEKNEISLGNMQFSNNYQPQRLELSELAPYLDTTDKGSKMFDKAMSSSVISVPKERSSLKI